MLYRFGAWLGMVYLKIFCWPVFEGLENVPKEGALIICANHISMLDMFLFAPKLSRPVYFMAKQELFKIPLLNLILKGVKAYPVNRGHGDLGAAKMTKKLLSEGKIVGIFPEGHRNKSKERVKPKLGAVLFALESGAPILPVRILGSYRLFSRIRVIYGKQYQLQSDSGAKATKQQMQEMVNDLMDRIYSLGEDTSQRRLEDI